MAEMTRKPRKADIYSLTPKLRETLNDVRSQWDLKADDTRRVRRCLAALPPIRLEMLESIAFRSGGKSANRKRLAEEFQTDAAYQAGKKPVLMPYMVNHLSALVRDGYVVERASGRGSEKLYHVPNGIVEVLNLIVSERQQAALRQLREERRAAEAIAAADAPAPALTVAERVAEVRTVLKPEQSPAQRARVDYMGVPMHMRQPVRQERRWWDFTSSEVKYLVAIALPTVAVFMLMIVMMLRG